MIYYKLHLFFYESYKIIVSTNINFFIKKIELIFIMKSKMWIFIKKNLVDFKMKIDIIEKYRNL